MAAPMAAMISTQRGAEDKRPVPGQAQGREHGQELGKTLGIVRRGEQRQERQHRADRQQLGHGAAHHERERRGQMPLSARRKEAIESNQRRQG